MLICDTLTVDANGRLDVSYTNCLIAILYASGVARRTTTTTAVVVSFVASLFSFSKERAAKPAAKKKGEPDSELSAVWRHPQPGTSTPERPEDCNRSYSSSYYMLVHRQVMKTHLRG